MAINEYRRRALECLWIADENTTSPENRTLLVGMAQAWLKLAQQTEQKACRYFFANKFFTYCGVRIPGFWKADPQSRAARPFARDLGGEDFRSPSRGFEVAETTTTALAWSYGKYWIA
jgi:hypothetical protein